MDVKSILAKIMAVHVSKGLKGCCDLDVLYD